MIQVLNFCHFNGEGLEERNSCIMILQYVGDGCHLVFCC